MSHKPKTKMTSSKVMVRKLQFKKKKSKIPKAKPEIHYHGSIRSPIPKEVLLKMKGDTNIHEKDSKLILKQTSKEHKS